MEADLSYRCAVEHGSNVVHEFERGIHHNTRCGLLLPYAKLTNEPINVTCVPCLACPSPLSLEDLVHGRHVTVLVALTDAEKLTMTQPARVLFDEGANVEGIVFGPAVMDAVVHGVAFMTRDYRVLHVSTLKQPVIWAVGNTVEFPPYAISLTS